ncbi:MULTISPECIES: hypothetical protein [Streptomyces]|jgi:hypothetical protein|uniref:Integral membrane protein n=1 Tax=Streptomyces spinosisporus TaxID=2927582 RepID=A0ABS9X9X6_9ACTN|nr:MULTISPECIES: hypothetical protein [Streptomyces]MCI3238856.1 hypothetical protein [Streptomyces spinosisporus]WUB34764.1 hypothetical protein OHN38_07535 [Streptomyces sp. NBC_00588]
MGQVVEAAAQFPTVILTSAVVVVLGYWLLVLLGRADARGFDADAPSWARALHGVPVAVSASGAIVIAWLVTLTGMVLMEPTRLTWFGDAAARVGLLALSGLVAWPVTHALAAPLARLLRDRCEPHRRDTAAGTPGAPGRSHSRR